MDAAQREKPVVVVVPPSPTVVIVPSRDASVVLPQGPQTLTEAQERLAVIEWRLRALEDRKTVLRGSDRGE
jgi:hypothetical protein